MSRVNVGFRVYTEVRRPDPAIIEAFKDAAAPNVGDAMHGITVVDSGIRAVHEATTGFVGPAVTVVLTPGDGLMLRKAIDVAKPGDVIVVNSFGCEQRAVIGGSVAIAAVQRGVVGLIVDGAVRDAGELRDAGLPVMARTVTPRGGSTPHGWGEVNVPIACGGVVVNPGDIIVADQEGIVVVPGQHAQDVLDHYTEVAGIKGRPQEMAKRIVAQVGGPTRGMERTSKAMTDRGATVVEGCYQDSQTVSASAQ